MMGVLNSIDTDALAQKMMLEQFVTEAAVAREVRFRELEASEPPTMTFVC